MNCAIRFELAQVQSSLSELECTHRNEVRDYPSPIVDHLSAARAARQRMASLRRGAAREEGQQILQRHGSRKGGLRPRP
jgi:hypothetical protein